MSETTSAKPEVNALGNALAELSYATQAVRQFLDRKRELEAAALDRFAEKIGQTVPLQGQAGESTVGRRTTHLGQRLEAEPVATQYALPPALYEIKDIDPRGRKVYLVEVSSVADTKDNLSIRMHTAMIEDLFPATQEEIVAFQQSTAKAETA